MGVCITKEKEKMTMREHIVVFIVSVITFVLVYELICLLNPWIR
jgi:hypothetical protein